LDKKLYLLNIAKEGFEQEIGDAAKGDGNDSDGDEEDEQNNDDVDDLDDLSEQMGTDKNSDKQSGKKTPPTTKEFRVGDVKIVNLMEGDGGQDK
jgi:hypothetical protein